MEHSQGVVSKRRASKHVSAMLLSRWGDVWMTGLAYAGRAAPRIQGGSSSCPLTIEKNNAVGRGVTIQGDVSIDEHNTELSHGVIEGNLTVQSNDVRLVESTVHGSVTIRCDAQRGSDEP